MSLGTRLQLQGRRRSVRTIQFFVAAGEALRAAHDPMLRTCKRADIHRDCVFVDWRGFSEHQPFDDFRSDQPIQRLQYGRLGNERLECRLVTGNVAQEIVNFLVAAQTASQAIPTGAMPVGAKDGAKQCLHAEGSHENPRRARLNLAPVHLSMARCKEVVAHNDREHWGAGRHVSALIVEMPGQPSVVTFNRDTRF